MFSVKFDNNQDKSPRGFLHKHLRLNHPGKVMKGHLNINSIRNTFELQNERLQRSSHFLIPLSVENNLI